MLPIYISYFAGGQMDTKSHKTLKNALGFVLGFTIVFVSLGAFAGTIGKLLRNYQSIVNVVAGIIVILFGLSFLGVIQIKLFKGASNYSKAGELGFFSSMIFGIVFSVGWTPCVGAFLGSALMLASSQGSAMKGIIMLLCYSVGLGIPFVISAILIDKLKSTFDFIKKHYLVINRVSGIFLIAIGIFMMTGMMGKFLSFITI